MDYDNLDFWEMVKDVYNCTKSDLIFVQEQDPNDSFWYLNDKSNPNADMELRVDCEHGFVYPKTHVEACKAFERQFFDYLFDRYVDTDNSDSDYNMWCNACDPTPHISCFM